MTRFAGIDVGTGGVRCLVVDERGRPAGSGARAWRYVPDDGGFPILPPGDVLAALRGAVSDALGAAGDGPVAAVGVCSQRTGVVLLDDSGAVLVVSPNADGRGAADGLAMERAHGEVIYRVAGRLPALIYLPARLSWFRAHRPEVFARVASALSLSDWIVAHLSGAARTEPTQAAEMLVYDVAAGGWSDELCAALEVPRALLPPVGAQGESAGGCRDGEGFAAGTPVLPAGADTQCALLALGAADPGEAVVVAGTTMLAAAVRADAEPDPQRRLWTSPHGLPGRFVREAHCGEAGGALDWVAALCGASAGDLAAEAATAAPGAAGIEFFDALPNPAADFALVRRAGLAFGAPLIALGRPRADVARAVLEGTAYGARAGVAWLEEDAAVTSLAVAGGVARSEVFVRALAGSAARPVRVATEPNASALGAAIVAAAAHHGGVREAAGAMYDRGTEVTPQEQDGYPALYAAWLQRAAEFDAKAVRVSTVSA